MSTQEPFAARWSRRALSISLVAFGLAFWLALAPVWGLAALVFDRGAPRRSAARAGLFIAWYLACELCGVAVAAGLWLLRAIDHSAARDERFFRRNVRLQTLWCSALWNGAVRLFGMHLELENDPGPDAMLLLMRHASVADSLLPTQLVSGPQGLHLRHVLKRELLWDPCLDIVGQRLPNYFAQRRSQDPEREIAAVARLLDGLGPAEGVVIFPEGTRFTETKRAQVLEKLRSSGDREALGRAESLQNVLLPRPGGTLGLLARNADAHGPRLDVVFCMHTGLDEITTLDQLWNGGLRDTRVRVRFERIPFGEIPVGEAERLRWLFEHWAAIDRWIDGARRDKRERIST